jgi:uncharacterized protein (TIGR03435 family)
MRKGKNRSKNPNQMLMRRAACWCFGLAVLGTLGVSASAQRPPRPSFDVVSVKQNTSAATESTTAIVRDHFIVTNETIWRVIGEAYAAPLPYARFRIIGGPVWVDTDRFDIDGMAPAPAGRNLDWDVARLMLQSMLAERFKLVVHAERRELPILELVLARTDATLGPELHRRDVFCSSRSLIEGPLPPNSCAMAFGYGRLTASGMSIRDLAFEGLSRATGGPVIDRTGLVGPFDWNLVWTPDNRPPRPAGVPANQPVTVNGQSIDPSGSSLATALREQLGLKLQSATDPVDVLVIDSIERPIGN